MTPSRMKDHLNEEVNNGQRDDHDDEDRGIETDDEQSPKHCQSAFREDIEVCRKCRVDVLGKPVDDAAGRGALEE